MAQCPPKYAPAVIYVYLSILVLQFFVLWNWPKKQISFGSLLILYLVVVIKSVYIGLTIRLPFGGHVMSSFLTKNSLSSEDVKKCSNVLLFGMLNSKNMWNHSYTKFWEFSTQTTACVRDDLFFTWFWAENRTSADVMTLKETCLTFAHWKYDNPNISISLLPHRQGRWQGPGSRPLEGAR